jgi:hypothetical protein
MGGEAADVLRGLAADARLAARRTAYASTNKVLSDADADALLMDARILVRIAYRMELLAEGISTGENAISG